MKKVLLILSLLLLAILSFSVCYADVIYPGQVINRVNVSFQASAGGTINPSGSFSTLEGRLLYTTITPDDGYALDMLLIDGKKETAQPSMMDQNGRVKAYFARINSHEGLTVSAVFRKATYPLTVKVSGGGSTDCDGTSEVNEGSIKTIKITPSKSYKIGSIKVNGKTSNYDSNVKYSEPKGDSSIGTLTLLGIDKEYTIEIEFIEIPVLKQEAPKVEEPKQEEPKQEETKKEEPKKEETKQEETKKEETKKEETKKTETVKLSVETKVSEGGKITPTKTTVNKGEDISFKISIDDGYKIESIKYDNDNVPFNLSKDGKSAIAYLENVRKKEVLYVQFEKSQDEQESSSSKKSSRFSDVSESDWFSKNVDFVVDNGLFSGTSETTFGPSKNLTRGMLVTVLYRLDKSSDLDKAKFTDVKSDEYYSTPIAWASKNEIVNGMSEELFMPDNNISRQDLASIIYRYAKSKGKVADNFKAKEMKYSDSSEISTYARDALSWCSENSIINGKSDNRVDPKGLATRAEASAIIERLNEAMK